MPEPSLKLLIAAIVLTFAALAIGAIILNTGGDDSPASTLQRAYDRLRLSHG